jgi:predicted lipid-binding transport protein (Tim44 family)
VSFTQQVPCFNVTAEEFTPASSTTSPSVPSSTAASQATAPAIAGKTGNGSGGLSGGAKAGIAVGSIVGVALAFALAFAAIRRKRRSGRDAEAVVAPMGKAMSNDRASVMSGKTAS